MKDLCIVKYKGPCEGESVMTPALRFDEGATSEKKYEGTTSEKRFEGTNSNSN